MKRIILLSLIFLEQLFFSQSAGTLDTSFGTNGIVVNSTYYAQQVNDMKLQSDGKIVTVGVARTITNSTDNDFKINRYNVDGSLDTSFGNGGSVRIDTSENGYLDLANTVEIQPDGKIVVGGYTYVTSSGSYSTRVVIRLNADGFLDNSFANSGILKFNFTIYDVNGASIDDIVIQPDGKIIIGGSASNSGTGRDFAVARLNSNGTFDYNFSNDGKLTISLSNSLYDIVKDILLLSDGKIMVGGSVSSVNFGWAKLLPDGSVDSSFGTAGKVVVSTSGYSYPGIGAFKFLDNGYVVGGGSVNNDVSIYKMAMDTGTLDSTFGTSGIVTVDIDNASNDDRPYGLEVDSYGGIYASGNMGTGGSSYYYLLNFNPNGTLNSNFSYDGKVLVNFGSASSHLNSCLVMQPDGKLVVGGYFLQSGILNDGLARFNNHAYLSTKEALSNQTDYFSIYPNPSSDYIFISTGKSNRDLNFVKIFDASGRIVKQAMISKVNSKVDVAKLLPGTYQVVVNGVSKKLLIK